MTARSPGVPFALVTVFLDVLTFGIVIPVVPELVKQFAAQDAAAASFWFAAMMVSFSLAQFLFAPVLGALSDRFGRRPILLASIAGSAVDQLLMAFAPSLWWLLAGRVVAGLTAANVTAANAYIADVSGPDEQARNFGMVGAAFGLGFIAGPALGGFLGEIDLRLPFFAAAALAGLNFLYGLFLLPESLKPENRRAFSWRRAHPVASFGALRANPTVFGLAWAQFCMVMAFGVLQTVWVLYAGQRYGFTAWENGLSLALVGLATLVVQGGLVGPIVARAGDRRAILGGLLVMALAYAAYGLAATGAVFCAAILAHALGSVAGPAVKGVIAKSVPADRQGETQGALASLNSLTFVAAPLIGATLFSSFTAAEAGARIPGMPFFFGAAMLLLAAFVAGRALRTPADTGAVPESKPVARAS